MVYENVLASSFIYALGAIAGQKAKPGEIIQDSVNFFQQTPKDKIIGDLLGNWQGKKFIVEFKRTIKDVSSELKKGQTQKLLDELKSNACM